VRRQSFCHNAESPVLRVLLASLDFAMENVAHAMWGCQTHNIRLASSPSPST